MVPIEDLKHCCGTSLDQFGFPDIGSDAFLADSSNFGHEALATKEIFFII